MVGNPEDSSRNEAHIKIAVPLHFHQLVLFPVPYFLVWRFLLVPSKIHLLVPCWTVSPEPGISWMADSDISGLVSEA